MVPAQPIHEPRPAWTIGARALTSPPGLDLPGTVVGADDGEPVGDDNDLVGLG